MGTKRHMAGHVQMAIAGLQPEGRVVDLFSGMGSVAESLCNTASVVTNDALSFTESLSRARFTGKRRASTPAKAAARLAPVYLTRLRELASVHASQLAIESAALQGDRPSTAPCRPFLS
jgi:adenine-specific DNA-methyltransferase